MEFFIKPDIPAPPFGIDHRQRLLLIGSCFTSNVGRQLEELKFATLHNPTGILFDPFSVVRHLRDALENRIYTESDLMPQDEIRHSPDHHTDFSSTDANETLRRIREAVSRTGEFLQQADLLFITLGSAYYYRLAETGERVANCHRFPAQLFTKHLAGTDEIVRQFQEIIAAIRERNPKLKIVFTVSPVRHIREGVVNNNRSKARLLEAVHTLCETVPGAYYFPAYELVIDVLRDYRFYDVDLVHPNYAATQFVFEQFRQAFFDADTQALCDRIREVTTAFRHKPNFPDTEAHRKFLTANLNKIKALEPLTPLADWAPEKTYFGA